jgi:hypothetical protein
VLFGRRIKNPIKIADTFIGTIVTARVPQIVNDTETDPHMSEDNRASARARGFRSFVRIPMLREGVAIGTITNDDPVPMDDEDDS